MAVFAVRGDLRRLACDAWYLPTDEGLNVEPGWLDGDEGLAGALRDARASGLRLAVETPRVAPLRLGDTRRATPVLGAIPQRGVDDWSYHLETLRQFAELAKSLERPKCMATRPRLLLAVPLIGTGASAVQPNTAQHLQGLLTSVHELSSELSVDFVVVARTEPAWAATQAVRRRLLRRRGPDAEIAHLVKQAEDLADRARRGQLVLFTGAGIGRPAGLPDWQGLLDQLANWAGIPVELARRLQTINALDQAAFIHARASGRDLAAEIARRLDAPHCALGHVLLANMPVQENVTLNYDELFERAATDAGRPVSVLPYEAARDRWLLKLHGCVRPERQRDIVLTRTDYLSLADHRATLTGLVQALLVTRHMLFVGFGLQDDHLHAVIHDVRRALGDGRDDKLGTALLLARDELQEELWAQDLHYVAIGGHDAHAAARRLEIFLDHVLLSSATSDAHLFDDGYEGLLTDDERELRDILTEAFTNRELNDAPAWTRVRRLLEALGWPERGRPRVKQGDRNRVKAAQRRESFAAKAPLLAEAAGLPTEPLDAGGFPLPSWARFTADDATVAVVVADGEPPRTVEKALAYGIAHARNRSVVLLLPHPPDGGADAAQATAARAAYLATPVTVRTHGLDGVGPEIEISPERSLESVWEPDLRGGVHDLGAAAGLVAPVVEFANSHTDLVSAHRGGYLAWHCAGRMLLTIRRTRGGGALVRAGVHYSQPGPGKPAPLEVAVTARIAHPDVAAVKQRVINGIVARLTEADTGHEEHRLQAALATAAATLSWGPAETLRREFPARRPGGGAGYIDFLRLDENGTLHVVETKIGDDEMLVLQGLDYWIWAQANRAALEDHFSKPISNVVIDYVIGVPGGAQVDQRPLLSSYAPAQLEALAPDVRWQVYLLGGWAQPPVDLRPLGPLTLPGPQHVRRRT